MMDGWNDGMGGGWGAGEWIMFVLAVVVVVAVTVGIVYLLRGLSGSGASGGAQGSSGHIDSPEDLLKRRYAAGEIDREDYESRLRDLRA